MKTPEEIKKGLECCIDAACMECPYYPRECDEGVMEKDVKSYIQQLEADNAKKDETIQMLQDGNASLMKMIDEECEKTVRLKLERDAAVRDLKSVQGGQRCERCKNYGRKGFNATVCIECINGSRWEWRGVQEKEGGNNV